MELAPIQAAALANWSGCDTDARLVELWLDSKASAGTRSQYARAIEHFMQVVGKPLRAVTLEDLRDYGKALASMGLSPATIRLRQMAVKSLLSFGARTRYLAVDVGRAWQAVKAPDTLSGRILSEGEVLQLIQAAKRERDKTLIRFLYRTGLRVSEAVNLTWANIREVDGGGAVIAVHGKGGKTRHIRISSKTLAALAALNPRRQGPVFISQKRKPLSVQRVRSLLASLGRKALGKPVSPHWLRHCMATHSLRRGYPIAEVAATLGHGSLAVTSRYLHANPITSPEDFLPDF